MRIATLFVLAVIRIIRFICMHWYIGIAQDLFLTGCYSHYSFHLHALVYWHRAAHKDKIYGWIFHGLTFFNIH